MGCQQLKRILGLEKIFLSVSKLCLARSILTYWTCLYPELKLLMPLTGINLFNPTGFFFVITKYNPTFMHTFLLEDV